MFLAYGLCVGVTGGVGLNETLVEYVNVLFYEVGVVLGLYHRVLYGVFHDHLHPQGRLPRLHHQPYRLFDDLLNVLLHLLQLHAVQICVLVLVLEIL